MIVRLARLHFISRAAPLAKCFIIAGILLLACHNLGYSQSTSSQATIDLALLRAAGHNRDVEIKSLLAQGANPNARAPKGNIASGYTPIMLLALHSHFKAATVQALQKAGADVNATDATGETALMHAATLGRLPIVKVLLGCGAQVDKVDADRQTAMMTAAFGGYDDIVGFLLAHGAKANVQNLHGQTALLFAADNWNRNGSAFGRKFYPRYVQIVQRLLVSGAKPNLAAKNGFTPLMAAAYHGNTEIVVDLLKDHADVNVRNDKGRTALQMAVRGKHEAVVHLLKQAGAKP